MGALGAFGIHVLAMYFPLGQRILKTEPVPLAQWAALVPVALLVFFAMEIHKVIWRLRHPPESVHA